MLCGTTHRRRMRAADYCLTGIAFIVCILSSLGAVLHDPDLVYWFNWANAEGKQSSMKVSLYAGFKVYCSRVEVLGNAARLCTEWENYDYTGSLCDGSGVSPPPSLPPPPPMSCVDVNTTQSYNDQYNDATGEYEPFCTYFSQCCPGGTGSGPHPTNTRSTITCANGMAVLCPVTCDIECPYTSATYSYNDIMCANIDYSMPNIILWYVGAGFMLIKFVVQRCIESTNERRIKKAFAELVLSSLTTCLLAAVIIIYATKCYPGEAFEDIFLEAAGSSQQILRGLIKPSFGIGFYLAVIATAAMVGSMSLSIVAVFTLTMYKDRLSEVSV